MELIKNNEEGIVFQFVLEVKLTSVCGFRNENECRKGKVQGKALTFIVICITFH